MTNYIPHHTKKIQILKRRELKLCRLIQRGKEEKIIIAAAEEVRKARIRVLRAQRAEIPPMYDPEAEHFSIIDDKISALLVTPIEEIIADSVGKMTEDRKSIGSMSNPRDEHRARKNALPAENGVSEPVSSGVEITHDEPTNPYASPVHADNDGGWELTGQTLDAKNVRYMRVGRTVVTWEKLRLLYNLILACVTVLTCVFFLSFMSVPFNVENVIKAVIGMTFVANACFCLGPFVDVYLSWLGWRSAFTTGTFFVVGMLISIPLTVITIMASAMPDF